MGEASAANTWTQLGELECSGLRWKALDGVAAAHLETLGARAVACAKAPPVVASPVVVPPPPEKPKGSAPTVDATPGMVSPSAVDHKAVGYGALMAKDFGLAEKEFRLALSLNPQDAEAHDGMALTHYLQRDFSGARSEMEAALRLADEPGEVAMLLSGLADLDTLDSNLPAAEQKLKDALRSDPGNAASYYEFAILYDLQGNRDSSMTMERRALALDVSGDVRATSFFAWPECRIQFDALAAEGQGDVEEAARQWSALAQIEARGELRWAPLKGRAAVHLAGMGTE
jgi:tetratricopeptide (TPR) repeat protein